MNRFPFLAHLNKRFKFTFLIICCSSSVCLSILLPVCLFVFLSVRPSVRCLSVSNSFTFCICSLEPVGHRRLILLHIILIYYILLRLKMVINLLFKKYKRISILCDFIFALIQRIEMVNIFAILVHFLSYVLINKAFETISKITEINFVILINDVHRIFNVKYH